MSEKFIQFEEAARECFALSDENDSKVPASSTIDEALAAVGESPGA